MTRIDSSVDARAAAFDTLARTLDRPYRRRGVFGLLAATLATGMLGAASISPQAAAKGKRRRKGRKKGRKGGGAENNSGATPPVLQICVDATECGTDAEGKMCACRTDSTNKRICTRINGRFLATGTCGDCQGAEQCIPVVSGGIECILPCK